MMEEYEWKDLQSKHLLKQLPKIIDNRAPDEIYHNIQVELTIKKKPSWIIPSVASAAAILLFSLIAPSFLKDYAFLSQFDQEIVQTESVGQSDEAHDSFRSLEIADEHVPNHILTHVPNNQTLLTYGIPDTMGQNVIPISILVDTNKEQQLNLLTSNINQIPVSKLGLGDSPLRDLSFSQEERVMQTGNKDIKDGFHVLIDGIKDHTLTGSSSSQVFEKSVEETFRWFGYKGAEYIGIESDKGLSNGQSLIANSKKGYFLYQLDESYPILLTPSPEEFESFDDALDYMKNNIDEYELKASIGNDVIIEKTEHLHDTVVVHFKEGSELAFTQETVLMLNSIMMTAKEFDYTFIRFEGANHVKQIGNIEFGTDLKVPLAPNPILIDES
ncbi:hypothetical protein [Litchfieldia alkalitelluris]|uniref:hypothetical protein n=1 Tax=Litchfieldia alkalitelluris TaxID=304268 RepID=UPI0011162214|nr:hypothetical protein [Litchfieldia alkalitelluris]